MSKAYENIVGELTTKQLTVAAHQASELRHKRLVEELTELTKFKQTRLTHSELYSDLYMTDILVLFVGVCGRGVSETAVFARF